MNITSIMSDKKSDSIFAYKDWFKQMSIFMRLNNFKIMSNTPISFEEFERSFERFIDVNRLDLPDIDIDFPDVKRESVIQKLRDTYGV